MSVFRQRYDYPLVQAMPENTWHLAKVIPISRAHIPRLVRMRNRKRARLFVRNWKSPL